MQTASDRWRSTKPWLHAALPRRAHTFLAVSVPTNAFRSRPGAQRSRHQSSAQHRTAPRSAPPTSRSWTGALTVPRDPVFTSAHSPYWKGTIAPSTPGQASHHGRRDRHARTAGQHLRGLRPGQPCPSRTPLPYSRGVSCPGSNAPAALRGPPTRQAALVDGSDAHRPRGWLRRHLPTNGCAARPPTHRGLPPSPVRWPSGAGGAMPAWRRCSLP